jgi:hypothetical protein
MRLAIPSLTSFILLLLLVASPARAQLSIGLHGGYSPDSFSSEGIGEGSRLLGGQLRMGLAGLSLIVNPSLDYYYDGIESVRAFQFNFNALIPLGSRHSGLMPYIGAGLGYTRVEQDGFISMLSSVSEVPEVYTGTGLNLVGGAELGTGPVRLFGEARYTFGQHAVFLEEDLEAGSGLGFTGGILFKVGY